MYGLCSVGTDAPEMIRREDMQRSPCGEGKTLMAKKHEVHFTAHKTVKEPVEVKFTTKDGKPVDFTATKPVKEEVEVDFFARNKK